MVFFYWQRRVMACGVCLISVLVLLSGPLWGAVAWSLALPLAASMLFILHFVYLAKEPKVIDREEADAGNSQKLRLLRLTAWTSSRSRFPSRNWR